MKLGGYPMKHGRALLTPPPRPHPAIQWGVKTTGNEENECSFQKAVHKHTIQAHDGLRSISEKLWENEKNKKVVWGKTRCG